MSFNISKFLKKLFYFFITKKMLISIIIALLFYILLKTDVFASNSDLQFLDFNDNVHIAMEQLTDYQSGDYYYKISDNNGQINLTLIPKSAYPNLKLYVSDNYTIQRGTRYGWSFYYNTSNSQVTNCLYYVFSNNAFVKQSITTHAWFYSYGADSRSNTTYFSSDLDVYSDNTYTVLLYNGNKPVSPYIENTLGELFTLENVTNLVINPGNIEISNLKLYIMNYPQGSAYSNTVYQTYLNTSSDFYNNGKYYIPVSIFKDYLTANYSLKYLLTYDIPTSVGPSQQDADYTSIYNPSSSEPIDDIEGTNDNIDKNFGILTNFLNNKLDQMNEEDRQRFLQEYNLMQQQLSQQQEQTEATKDTNQFLKNQNFDNNNLNLPNDGTNDITQDGINNIFTMIYNAFCSGQAQNVVFPIPFTNTNITIPANYISDVLSATSFSWVKTFIELFWWYIISSFIVKDIAKKMNKAKSGDFENLENSNIKEDML